jgi:hypothetical protein
MHGSGMRLRTRPVVRASRIQVLALAAALCGPAVHAQAPTPVACPPAADVTAAQLVGLWQAQFDGGQGPGATLLLEPHREYVGSLSGEINRNGERARVAADLEDGEFTLEESPDGKRIGATWIGEVAEGSCGREIRGTRTAPWTPAQPFVLRKTGG